MFESTVTRFPDATALVFGDRATGYAELNARANQLARRFVALGIGPDTLVAVAVPRSDELITVLLAVLKAGGAYLPLDPTYPADRLAYMIADAEPVLFVRSSEVGLRADGTPEYVVDQPELQAERAREATEDLTDADRLAPLDAAHLMYVIYTSGSTGTPKGVAVPHAGVADMIATHAERIGPGPGDRVLQWASISFDAAFWDITLALLSGATLVMASADDVLPGDPLHETLRRHEITHATLPPVALSVTDSEGVLVNGTVMSTGDACTPTLVRKWAPGRRLFNGYGPTEVTVGSTFSGPVAPDDDEITIGIEWTGERVQVLDDRLDVTGGEGELYLSGPGIARGYLNRPGLTAVRFVPDPQGEPGSRMYRSGDRGSRRSDGELLFAGRADAQVKVRGFRVELGEVEAALTAHPGVGLAVATVEGDLADARVVAFVTPAAGQEVAPQELRQYVGRSLPEHMVPSMVTVLEHFPTTSNGKIDRAALRTPAATATAGHTGWHEGMSYDDALCAMVAELLGVPVVTPDQNFFEIGGHSVLATKLAGRIRQDLGVKVPIRSLFESTSLSELARAVEKAA
ncbi:non-ribosomal peptide synthetase [Kribbella sandramycini]|uniref:Amino acid adenylation domain-containing protein n=1 Tax=Kribbella sandramycini TaxID=60450 RepID=A0A7Y4KXI1_9ACTN|nr:non-ribosomal peptide synthetase [Kribbella sandramycini]MBB6569692.1 amino acid adenylation domain-containing protein [Kribbella sandramycini]NOL40477.1 non-ribosomal peptide synthetase [Kribbella sandramycini]